MPIPDMLGVVDVRAANGRVSHAVVPMARANRYPRTVQPLTGNAGLNHSTPTRTGQHEYLGPLWRRPLRVSHMLLILAVSSMGIGAASVADETPSAQEQQTTLYDRMLPRTVDVLVDGRHGGSGWFVDPSGLLVTAAHVLHHPGRRVEVLLIPGDRLACELVAVDLGHDVALLRAPPRDGGYPAVTLADTVPAPGTRIHLVGSGLFRRGLLFEGLVGQRGTRFEYNSVWNDFGEVVHVCGTIVAGTSGGCWFDEHGNVVGVQSSTFSVNSVPTAIANMAPVEAIRRLVQTRQNARTPTLGLAVEEIWQQAPDYLKRFPPGTEGLVMRSLAEDGPAARAGLHKMDLLVAVDSQPAASVDGFMRLIRAKQPGHSVKLRVLDANGAGPREAEVPLGLLEAGWPGPEEPKPQ